MGHLSDRIVWLGRSKIPPLVTVLVSGELIRKAGGRCIRWIYTGGFG
jgi:hypothetical protein